MNREEKVRIKQERAKQRRLNNKERNRDRYSRNKLDCPFDVEMNGTYGTCNCGGVNYESCCGDI